MVPGSKIDDPMASISFFLGMIRRPRCLCFCGSYSQGDTMRVLIIGGIGVSRRLMGSS
jgi:hypothetical protein